LPNGNQQTSILNCKRTGCGGWCDERRIFGDWNVAWTPGASAIPVGAFRNTWRLAKSANTVAPRRRKTSISFLGEPMSLIAVIASFALAAIVVP